MVPLRDLSSSPYLTGEEFMSEAEEVDSHIGCDLFGSWHLLDNFSSSVAILRWIPGHNNDPGNDTYLFCHNDGSLLHTNPMEIIMHSFKLIRTSKRLVLPNLWLRLRCTLGHN